MAAEVKQEEFAGPWWTFSVVIERGQVPGKTLLSALAESCEFFIHRLTSWAEGSVEDRQYRILSASELLNDPYSLYIIQSDEAGEDGFGYFMGYIGDKDPNWWSYQWKNKFGEQISAEDSSGAKELFGLLHALQENEVKQLRNKQIVWVTDSQASFFAVNKGSSSNTVIRRLLSPIFNLCDQQKLHLLALWVPREQNQLADYLSHLATQLDREEAHGTIRDLRGIREGTR